MKKIFIKLSFLVAGLLIVTTSIICVSAVTTGVDDGVVSFQRNYVLGDANFDDTVDVRDLVRFKKYLAEMEVEIDNKALDIDCDGLVSAQDLVQLRLILLNA